MSPVFSTIRIELEEPKSTSLAHEFLRKGLSSDVAPSPSSLIDAFLSIPTNPPSSVNDLASPTPTQPLEIGEKDSGYEYVTLSVTLPYTTYTTTVLLGDSFPTSTTNDLVPTTYAVPSSSSDTKVQTPGIPTGTSFSCIFPSPQKIIILSQLFFLTPNQFVSLDG
jgi:hypothetical protein